ncbi:hypothetical protein CR513_32917, partial [Mucuna pruriens]
MKVLGETSFWLGIQILRYHSQSILMLSQDSYVNKVLDIFDMKDSKLQDTLIANVPNNDLERNEMQKIPYGSAVGNLMHAQICTCPHIALWYLSDPSIESQLNT